MKKAITLFIFCLLFLQATSQCWKDLSVGNTHSLAIKTDGTLWAWGSNGSGALGDGTNTNRNTPVQIGTANNWLKIAAGAGFSLGIKSDGTLWTWGTNSFGQLGDGTTSSKNSPSQVGTSNAWSIVTAGNGHSMALQNDGSLWGWGYNGSGQLGDGLSGNYLVPTLISNVNEWSTIVAGGISTFGIKLDGTLWGWGGNTLGNLGDGTTAYKLVPTQIGVGSTWLIVAPHTNFTCAIKSDGTLWSWGYNNNGQLGIGSIVQKLVPTQVGVLQNWVRVDVGEGHTLAIQSNGSLWSWGRNLNGQLGDGTTVQKTSPIQVGTSTWTNVHTGTNFSIGQKSDGIFWGWGVNTSGFLGDGTNLQRTSPVVLTTYAAPGLPTLTATNTSICVGSSTTLTVASGALNSATYWKWYSTSCGGTPIGTGTSITVSPTATTEYFVRGEGGCVPLPGVCNSIVVTVNTSSPPSVSISSSTSTINPGETIMFTATPTNGGASPLYQWKVNGVNVGNASTSPNFLSTTLTNGQSISCLMTTNTACTALSNSLSITVNPWSSNCGWRMIDANEGHNLAIKNDGTLWSWGYNFFGQLGDGTQLDKSTPIQIGTANDWKSIAVGNTHSLAIKNNGTLWAWGNNNSGQLGDGTNTNKSLPVQIGTATNWASLTAGYERSFAVKTDGTLWAWGDNTDGQLGDGTTLNIKTAPIQIGTSSNWLLVSSRYNHTLALHQNGTLWAWGDNTEGQLGDATTVNKIIPTQIGINNNWYFIAAGYDHSSAIQQNHSLWLWGNSSKYQIGYGGVTNVTTPIQVGSQHSWQEVSCGYQSSVAIQTNGIRWAWGDNSNGQYGLGVTTQAFTPVATGTTLWNHVVAGTAHVVALQNDGSLWTNGANNVHQLGNGNTTTQLSPVQIFNCCVNPTMPTITPTATTICAGSSTSLSISSGSLNSATSWQWYATSCGGTPIGSGTSITVSPTVNTTYFVRGEGGCVGTSGACGQIVITVIPNVTSAVSILSSSTSISEGETVAFTATPTNGGTLPMYQWKVNGMNAGGPSSSQVFLSNSLSDGQIVTCEMTSNAQCILPVTSLSNGISMTVNTWPTTCGWRMIDANGGHNVAIKNDGTLWGWGSNSFGQLGDGTQINKSTLTQIGSANDWKIISVGYSHTLAIKNNGTLWAWGNNSSSQLGDGTNINKSTPVQIGTATNWASISATFERSFAIKSDGTLWAWGANSSGQLGDGTFINKNTPVQIGTSSNWVSLSSKINHTLALQSDGTLWAWGANSSGQLGDGTTANKIIPTQIGVANTWYLISAGHDHSTAIQLDHTLWAWGNNSDGQLGNGGNINSITPIQVGSQATWREVSCGSKLTLALQTDGTRWAWGDNSFGQFGDGSNTTSPTPMQIGIANTWSHLAAGQQHAVALQYDGSIWSNGLNSFNQLGNGNSTNQLSPQQIYSCCVNLTPASILVSNSILCIGGTTTLSVASGSLNNAASWTWYTNVCGGIPIGIGNSINVSPTATTTYSVRGEGGCVGQYGVCASVVVQVVASPLVPVVTISHNPASLHANETAVFTATPTNGGPTPIYQWKINGVNVGTATSSPIFLSNTLSTGQSVTCEMIPQGICVQPTTVVSNSIPVTILPAATSSCQWKSIAAGQDFSIAIKPDGNLYSWGDNTYGQLGRATFSAFENYLISLVPLSLTCTQVAAGGHHALAILNDGSLWAWGDNSQGQLGDGSTNSSNMPIQIGTEVDWKFVCAGDNFSLGLKNNGTIWAWGQNNYGQLGIGSTTMTLTPTQIGSSNQWKQLDAGTDFVMAIQQNGTLWGWGHNSDGQLGNGTYTNSNSPLQIGILSNWFEVSSGATQTMALQQNGIAYAWGINYSGLGNGIHTSSNVPLQISNTMFWKQVASGASHNALQLIDGTLWTWGVLTQSVFGNNDPVNIPTLVNSAITWNQFSLGSGHILATKQDGSLWSWGGNGYGQLGLGFDYDFMTNSYTPTPYFANFPKLVTTTCNSNTTQCANWQQVKVSKGNDVKKSLAIHQDGTLWTWGASIDFPVQISGDTDWQTVNGSTRYGFGLKQDGSLWAWGWGYMGDGSSQRLQNTPLHIGNAPWQSMSVSVFPNFILAIKQDGTLWSWGENYYGQLGDGSNIDKLVPTQIGNSNQWVQVTANYGASFGIKQDGTLWAWGQNADGRLCDGTTNNANTPIQIGSATDWQQVVAGGTHVVALKTNGTLWTWGFGTLGDGTYYSSSTVPLQIGTASNWELIETNGDLTIAKKNDGTLWYWGTSQDANYLDVNVPTQMSGNYGQIVSIGAGDDFYMFLNSAGNMYAWGRNHGGQFGSAANNLHHLTPESAACITTVISILNITPKLFLQGYYTGSNTMATVLTNQGIGSSTTNVDSVTIELREAASPYVEAANFTGVLQTDGNLVCTFPGAVKDNSYYIVIKHRNGIETWSSNPVLMTSNASYDFTNAANKAYGDNQVEVESGVWAMYTGDINQDGFIDSFDFPALDTDIFNGVSGVYVNTDLNGDGFVDSFDFPVFDVNSFNGVSIMTP